jgi:lipid-A-disaccharide synthase
MPHIWLIAGEASGDFIGGKLVHALQAYPNVWVQGIGGQHMIEAGLSSLFPMEELSVMGFLELLPHLQRLRARLQYTIRTIIAEQPEIVVTIDSPGFCFRVAKALRQARARGEWQGKLVHYVAPSVWAWKPKRAKKVAALYDQLFCLLPFEPPYFTQHGLRADFVGHPIVEAPIFASDVDAYRAVHNLSVNDKPLLVLAGSRTTEVSRLLPIFLAAAQKLDNPPLLLPTLPHLIPTLQTHLASYPAPYHITTAQADKYAAMRCAAYALAASGTVSLELAMAGTPTIIAYRVHPLTAAIAKRLIKIPYASVINILANKPLMPEFIQEHCTADNLANALRSLAPQAESLQPYLEQLQCADGTRPSIQAAKFLLE